MLFQTGKTTNNLPYIIVISSKKRPESARIAFDLDFQSPTKYRSTSGVHGSSNRSFDHFDTRLKALELRRRLNISLTQCDRQLRWVYVVLCDVQLSINILL
jgi:hypothetical protein